MKGKGGKKRLLILFSLLVFSAMLAFLLVRMLDSGVVARATKLRTGMSRDEVLQIMGKPTWTNMYPAWTIPEIWDYPAPTKVRFFLSLRPFQIRLWERRERPGIEIGFGEDQKVFMISIPQQ